MKEYKKELKCETCNLYIYCNDKKMFPIVRDAWEEEHAHCDDYHYVRQVKVSFKGGDSTWI